MSWPSRAESFLEWWDETELPRLRAEILADPSNRQLAVDLAHAEKEREVTYQTASDEYDRQQDDDYRAQWASWAFGPDVNGVDEKHHP